MQAQQQRQQQQQQHSRVSLQCQHCSEALKLWMLLSTAPCLPTAYHKRPTAATAAVAAAAGQVLCLRLLGVLLFVS
jgi:hypothetical protein